MCNYVNNRTEQLSKVAFSQHTRPHKHKSSTHNSPHTKLLEGAWKMLVPLRLSGWAQVALTPACKVRVTNQLGNQWSWQSHRKLSL